MSDSHLAAGAEVVEGEDTAEFIGGFGLNPDVLRAQNVDLDALLERLQDTQWPLDPNVCLDALDRGLDFREFDRLHEGVPNQDYEQALQDYCSSAPLLEPTGPGSAETTGFRRLDTPLFPLVGTMGHEPFMSREPFELPDEATAMAAFAAFGFGHGRRITSPPARVVGKPFMVGTLRMQDVEHADGSPGAVFIG